MNQPIDHLVTPNTSEPKLPPPLPGGNPSFSNNAYNKESKVNMNDFSPQTISSEIPSLADSSFKKERQVFLDDFVALPPPISFHTIIEAILKHPARIVYEVINGATLRVTLMMIAIASVCLLIYGGVMGSFSGGPQLWIVPIKIMAGTFLSALLCLPSLYIFSCVAGGQLTLRAATGLLATMITLAGLLLLGLAPIAWLFSQGTGTIIFMGILHLFFWIVVFRFGLRLLTTATSVVSLFSKKVILFWGIIFIMVTLQVATNLRPIIGPYEELKYPTKIFFIEHWSDCMKAGK